jgi:Flp pilus assembly protein TadG
MRQMFCDKRGNVAITFALSLIPVFGVMGAAVDYTLANAQRTEMQAALDATALSLAKIMPLSRSELDARGMQFFKANLGTMPVFKVKLTVKTDIGRLTLSATGRYKATLVKVLGISEFPIGATAEARWGSKKVEIALALDNTGSMASNGKMKALKDATHNLIDMVRSTVEKAGDAKIAIVPFDTTVNIGTGYKDEFWVDYDVNKISKKKWQGCVVDRDQPNDVLDTAPNPKKSNTHYPAADCGSLVRMLPLTENWKLLGQRVDEMTPNGYTNVTMGLVWAWHALTPTDVLTQASKPVTGLEKYIVLLTDGDNTQNRWGKKQADIDQRTKEACKNAKAAGIRIFTVRVIDGNADLLRQCASSESMYFDVQQVDQLVGVFNSIGWIVAKLHLSK